MVVRIWQYCIDPWSIKGKMKGVKIEVRGACTGVGKKIGIEVDVRTVEGRCLER